MEGSTINLQQCNELAEAFGIRTALHPAIDGRWYYAYNGKTLDITARFDGRLDPGASHAIHDIAHWLCAPKTRRSLPEFGLGSSVDMNAAPANTKLKHATRADEECYASILGILMERCLGMPHMDTYFEHYWNWREFRLYLRTLPDFLQKRGNSLQYILAITCLHKLPTASKK